MRVRFWHQAGALVSLVAALLACKRSSNQGPSGAASATNTTTARSDGVVTVSQEQHASWIRNFNPLLAENVARFPTLAGIYEPLMIYNSVKAEWVPWLATGYEWADGNKLLRFKIRPEVKWSDGQPFSARDVAFTFELTRKFPALDLNGVWQHIDSVRAADAATVEFHFKQPRVPLLFYIAHRQPIVPEHKWKDVSNPVTFANPEPVATGPFTQVNVFQSQVYELGRNPNYWQKGKPYVKALRFPAFPSNDQANLALLNGEVDWAGNFVPDIQKTFVDKDPKHHHYWFPLVGSTVMLYLNNAKPPFDDPRLRKALSMGIDRKQIVRVAMYDYTRPADALGLSDAHKRWRRPALLAGEDWTQLDVAKANELLDSAGYKRGAGGIRQAKGAPIRVEVLVPSGWSDWVRAVQMITQNLKQLGIDATLKAYDFGAWFQKMHKGEFAASIGWSQEGPSPYFFYRSQMSRSLFKPLGETSAYNWHRGAVAEAEPLFQEFERTADDGEQQRISEQLQGAYVRNAPSLPLFYSPVWGEYNDKRITGFPNAQNPYARLSTFPSSEYLLVMVELKPRTQN